MHSCGKMVDTRGLIIGILSCVSELLRERLHENNFEYCSRFHLPYVWTMFFSDPVFAAKKADPDGDYVREWVPELALLPVQFIHCPWEAPPTLLTAAGLRLLRRNHGIGGKGGPPTHEWLGLHTHSYPRRIITNLEVARQRSHDWVIAVRNTSEGRSYVMKDGNDMLVLHDGRVARLITRVDFRTDSKRPMTFQSAEVSSFY